MRIIPLLAILMMGGCAKQNSQNHGQALLDIITLGRCEATLRHYAVQGKVTLLHFWASWCYPCHEVGGAVFHRFGGRREGDSNRFDVPFKMFGLDIGDPRNEGVLQRCDQQGIPADLVFDKHGRLVLNASPYEVVENRTGVEPVFLAGPEDEKVEGYIKFLIAVVESLL